MRRIATMLPLAILAALLFAGCSSPATPAGTSPQGAGAPESPVPEANTPGDIPDNIAFVPFKTAGGFTISTPEGWSRVESPSGVEFTDKTNTVLVTWSRTGSAPTIATVKSADVPKLAVRALNFEYTDMGKVSLPAGPAVRLRYREDGLANPVTGKRYRLEAERYTLFHNGTRVDLTLLSPVGSDNVDPWRTVSRSLKW